MKHSRRMAGALARSHGEAAEIQAGAWLRSWALCVERVRVGYSVRRGPGGQIISAHALEKVSGDFRGVAPGGRSVLAEVKARPVADGLSWSDLEPHQRDALWGHRQAGGLSLVLWAGMDSAGFLGLRWLEFPDGQVAPDWWRKGRPLAWDDSHLHYATLRPVSPGRTAWIAHPSPLHRDPLP